MHRSKRKREEDVEEEGGDDTTTQETHISQSTRAAALAAFTGTGADLAKSLESNSIDAISSALATLRTVTGRNSHDERLSPSDKRIKLAMDFCQAGGIGQENVKRGLLHAWDLFDSQDQISLLPVPIFVLSNLISLLGSHQPTHEIGDALIQTLLPAAPSQEDETAPRLTKTSIYWTRLQEYLSQSGGKNDASLKNKASQSRGSQEVVTLATLRLLLEMTTFAGGKYARNVFDNMNWNLKSLPRLSSMRRRTNNHKKGSKIASKPKNVVSLDRPDIRTLWILFLLSFLCSSTGVAQPGSLQVAVLSLGRDFLPAILKGLANDPPQIVVHILMALHDGLISDEAASKLPRSKVVGFFSEWACKEMLSLYDREEDLISVTATGDRHSIADVVHHFMLALCTHPGRGICYVDQGWYGRRQIHSEGESVIDDEAEEDGTTGVFNKVLLGLLKSLSPSRSTKQAELTLRILGTSQELLAPYLSATTGSLSSASLEPRAMSIAWLSTAAFMSRVLGIALPDSSKWKALPPPADRCLESILPASLTKAILIRGIHHKDRLTRHGALDLTCRVLQRLLHFQRHCQDMSTLYEEVAGASTAVLDKGETSAREKELLILRGEYNASNTRQKPWLRLYDEVIDEARLRLPDLAAILSCIDLESASSSSTKNDERAGSDTAATVTAPKLARSLLLIEAALRGARLHYRVFGEASTMDIGRLLYSASLLTSQVNDSSHSKDDDEENNLRLSLVCRLHSIELLTLFAKRNTGGLDFFVKQGGKEFTPFRHLLRLATSPILDEVRQASRELVKESMLGTILFNHNDKEWDVWQYALDKSSECILDFFDECVQRCLKTPYRYIELARARKPEWQEDLSVSPVFFTMVQQHYFRLQNDLLETDDTKVAFLSFVGIFLPALLTLFPSHDSVQSLLDVVSERHDDVMLTDRLDDADGEEKVISDQSRALLTHALRKVVLRFSRMKAAPKSVALLADSSTDTDFSSLPTNEERASTANKGTRRLLPTDIIWHLTQESSLDYMTIDWDTLSFSVVETNMMLTYCRNALIGRFLSIQNVEKLFKATLEYGKVDLANVRRIVLDNPQLYAMYEGYNPEKISSQDTSQLQTTYGDNDPGEEDMQENLATLTKADIQPLAMLLEAIVEAPIDSESQKEVDYIPKKLIQLSVSLSKNQLNEREKVRRLRTAVIQLAPFLSDSSKTIISIHEKALDLSCEAASGFDSYQRSQIDAAEWVTFFAYLMKSDEDSRIVRKGLLLWRQMKIDEAFTMESPSLQEISFAGLLSRPDVSSHDDVLCSLLSESLSFCRSFWRAVISHKDKSTLVVSVPLSLARAATSLEKYPGSFLKPLQDDAIFKACIERIFDEDQSIALPLSQVCFKTSRLNDLSFKLFSKALEDVMPTPPSSTFKQSAMLLAVSLIESESQWISSRFVQALLEKSLLWLVRRFAEDKEEEPSTLNGIESFSQLLNICRLQTTSPLSSLLKAHLVEPVLLAAVANRLDSKVHLRLIRCLTRLTSLKHTFLEKLLGDILNSREAVAEADRRKEVVAIVYDTFQADHSLCKSDLITSLIKLYGGTLLKTDRKLMKIFHLHESKNKVSILSQLQLWRLSSLQSTSEVNLGLLSRLDPVQIHETSLRFPRERAFENLLASGYSEDSNKVTTQEAVYDPLLLLAIVGTLAASEEALSGLQWLELVRTNALGVVVCSLSSKWPSTRRAASRILATVYSKINVASFQEKDHLVLILDFIRNSYTTEDVSDLSSPSSLPLTTTLFVAHSLRSLGIPSLYLYPLISRFLLQRSTPDPTDVPLLYNFLYTSSAQSSTAKTERIFMLRFLLTCIKYGGKVEWNIMKRRHVWDSICSLYAAETIDSNVKRIIEDIFLVVSCKPDLAFRIVARHSWLNYVAQVQLMESPERKESSRLFWKDCMTNLSNSIKKRKAEENVKAEDGKLFAALHLLSDARYSDGHTLNNSLQSH